MDVLVRPYRPEDRDGVRRVYADTAFFGRPVEVYLDDRELFADLGVSVYTDHYPDYIFVACPEHGRRADAASEAVGYVLGSPTGDVGVRARTLKSLPGILGRLATCRYRIGRKTLVYVSRSVLAGLRGEMLEIRSAEYPANLHINLEAGYRGRGLGTALMRAYLDKLRFTGVPGVHVVTTNLNRAALRLYQRAGFQFLQEKRTQMWQRYVDGEVRLMAFGLRLGEAGTDNPLRREAGDQVLQRSTHLRPGRHLGRVPGLEPDDCVLERGVGGDTACPARRYLRGDHAA